MFLKKSWQLICYCMYNSTFLSIYFTSFYLEYYTIFLFSFIFFISWNMMTQTMYRSYSSAVLSLLNHQWCDLKIIYVLDLGKGDTIWSKFQSHFFAHLGKEAFQRFERKTIWYLISKSFTNNSVCRKPRLHWVC